LTVLCVSAKKWRGALTNRHRLKVVDGCPDRDKKETDMLFSLKRGIAVAGITCALAGVGPIAVAGAATPAPFAGFGAGASFQLPNAPLFPGLSCGVNQGLFPGFVNLGPTGPLGPLGAYGPLGSSGNNLPCGAAAFNLGPGGPLGAGGALGSLYGQQH
jgi:hypothetical protein